MIGLLITVLVGLIVVGLILWAVQAFPWIDADFKHAAKIVIVVIFVLWLIGVLLGYMPEIPMPALRR